MPDDAATDLRRWHEHRDEEALARLCHRFAPLVTQTCRRLRAIDADDAVQAVFLILTSKGADVDPRFLAGWLVATARRVVANQQREAQRRHQRERLAAPMMAAPPSTEGLDWERVQPILDAALADLSPARREAIVRFHLLGESQAAIANAVQCSEGAVKQRIHQGLEQLRRQLGRAGVTLSVAGLATGLAQEAAAGAALPVHAPLLTHACLHGGTATATTLATAVTTTAISLPLIITGVASMLAALALVVVLVVPGGQAPPVPPPPMATATDWLDRTLDQPVSIAVEQVRLGALLEQLQARCGVVLVLGRQPGSQPDEPLAKDFAEPEHLIDYTCTGLPLRTVLDQVTTLAKARWERRHQVLVVYRPVEPAQVATWIAIAQDATRPFHLRRWASDAATDSLDPDAMRGVWTALHTQPIRFAFSNFVYHVQGRDYFSLDLIPFSTTTAAAVDPADPPFFEHPLLRPAIRHQIAYWCQQVVTRVPTTQPIDPWLASEAAAANEATRTAIPDLLDWRARHALTLHHDPDLDHLIVSALAATRDATSQIRLLTAAMYRRSPLRRAAVLDILTTAQDPALQQVALANLLACDAPISEPLWPMVQRWIQASPPAWERIPADLWARQPDLGWRLVGDEQVPVSYRVQVLASMLPPPGSRSGVGHRQTEMA